MTTKAHTAKKVFGKPVLSRTQAKAVVRKAKMAAKVKAKKAPKGKAVKTATWQKGGKQWARVLGHFGPAA